MGVLESESPRDWESGKPGRLEILDSESLRDWEIKNLRNRD